MIGLYKLFHRWFGWDYIHWKNTASQGIRRVYVLPDGTPYYWRYRSIRVMDIIREPEDVSWLTCDPMKYLDMSVEDIEARHA